MAQVYNKSEQLADGSIEVGMANGPSDDAALVFPEDMADLDRKSTRLNSSH